MILVYALVALRPDGRSPTAGEARFAAAVFALRSGRIGVVGLPGPDQLAARQFAVVAALVPDVASVWDAARTVGLLLGAATAVLLWAVLRRLGCGLLPTALAVVLVGATPPALALHDAANGASVAVSWLLVAALLCWRGRVPGIAAAVAALLAALTTPLVGAVLLALAAHAVVERTVSGTTPARRGLPLAAALGVAAAGLAAASAGGGPLAGQAAPMVGTGAAVAGAAGGLVVVVVGWQMHWVRPLLGPSVVALAALLVPGPGRAAAAAVALVLCAGITAAVADDLATRVATRAASVLRTVVTAGAAVAAVVTLPAWWRGAAGAPAVDPAPAPLLAWAGDQETAGAMLHADPLDRAQLVEAGFPAERLRELGAPVAAGDIVLLADRPHPGAPRGGPVHCAAGTLLAAMPDWDGAPAELCGARPVVADPAPAEQPSRVRIGTALAGNSGLQLAPGAAQLLREGAVDPRVMIVLAAMSGSHTLTVADFPLPPLAPPGSVRQQVLVTAVDGAPPGGDTRSVLRDWLAGQRSPFAPAVVRDDGAGLLVGYRDAAPAGLLPT